MSNTLGEELYRISEEIGPCDSAVKDFVDRNIISKYTKRMFEEANKCETSMRVSIPDGERAFYKKGFTKIAEYITSCYGLAIKVINYNNGRADLVILWNTLNPTVRDCYEFNNCQYPEERKFSYR